MWLHAYYPLSCLTLIVLFAGRALEVPVFLALIGVIWGSVLVHELGHVIAVHCTGGDVLRVRTRPWHGVTTIRHSGPLAGAVAALAGPAAGLMTAGGLLMLGVLDPVGVVHPDHMALRMILWACLLDNLLNLLPVWNLDGNVFLRNMRVWRARRAGLRKPCSDAHSIAKEFPLVASAIRSGCPLAPAKWRRDPERNRPAFTQALRPTRSGDDAADLRASGGRHMNI